jgi:hypothetical protein
MSEESTMQVIDVPAPTPVSNAPVLAPGDTALAPQPGDEAHDDKPEGDEQKPEKSPERMLKQLERRNRALLQSRAEFRERARMLELQLQSRAIDGTNESEDGDSGKLSLTPAELQARIEARAKELAPRLAEQTDVEQQRRKAVATLQTELGPERFDELADELADLLPRDAMALILDTDAPTALLEYLTDPEHEAETRKIARLSPYHQGMQIGMLAATLTAKRSRAAPKASSAPAPIEAVKSQGDASMKPLALLSDEEFAKRRRAQIAARR